MPVWYDVSYCMCNTYVLCPFVVLHHVVICHIRVGFLLFLFDLVGNAKASVCE